MKDSINRALALFAAIALVLAAFGGAASTGMVEVEDGPVGEAEAIACGGVCVIGAAAAAGVAVGAVSGAYIGANFLGDSSVNSTALAQADAAEAKKEIYTLASTQQQNNRVFIDSFENYVQDSESTALMIGKNAYIRALENGSAEATARIKAKEAVSDYYAKKQIQLANNWDTSVESVRNAKIIAQSHPNVSSKFVEANASMYHTGTQVNVSDQTATLVNSSKISVEAYKLQQKYSGDHNTKWHTIYIGGLKSRYNGPSNANDARIYGWDVQPPNSNYSPLYYHRVQDYRRAWAAIEQSNSKVTAQIDTFVDSTYSQYQEGAIDSTDLVDPYLGARKYSPEDNYGSWSLRTLSSMGLNPPKELHNVGTMTVEDMESGQTIEGVLMSDGVPPNGSFQTGTTYNASSLTGLQYVVNQESGTTHELSGEFRLTNVTTMDGNTTDSVDYRTIEYETTDLQEFKALQEDIRNLTATIEARQSNLRDGGSSGGLFPEFGGTSVPLPVAGGAILVVLVLVIIPALYRP